MGIFTLFLKIFNLPTYYKDIPLGLLVVNWFFQRILRINKDVPFSVNFTSRVKGYKNMNLSESARKSMCVSGGCYIAAFEGSQLTIREKTIFAPNVTIHTANHDFMNRDIHHVKDITIEDNSWLGAGSVILSGARLGKNVTVGANSVVTGAYPDNCVIAGVPAKIIKKL